MKKPLIEQLVNMNDLELLEILELLFNKRRRLIDGDTTYQETLMLVEHSGSLNSENGGFLPSIDRAKFIALPIDTNNLQKSALKFELMGVCPSCSIEIKGGATMLKCPYCYSIVECY